ncbi:MAG: hypothetical protein P1V97_38940, partial [Planctomycetota bacterium]|nr:hypothetical protein [Planctomycetota bacterium]
SPISSKRSLDSKLKSITKDLAKKHLKLAKKLVKSKKNKQEWASWIELKCASRADPSNRSVEKLMPKFEPFPPKKVNPNYNKARKEIDLYAKKKLGELLERGQRGKLSNSDLEPVATALIAYYSDHLKAREVLGFKGRSRKWLNDRQLQISASFQNALKKVPEPKDVGNKFPRLAQVMGLTLLVRETDHCMVAGEGKNLQAIMRVARAAEVAYAAIHKDMFGVGDLIKREGDRATTGVKLKAFKKPLFLVLDSVGQHQVFLDKVVTDGNLKVRGKNLAFISSGWKASTGNVLILESRMGATHCEEWAGMLMTFVCLRQRFGSNRPAYVVQGLARYYSGQVSGRAYLKVVAGGTMSDANKELMRRGDFDQLRWTARWAYDHFRAPLPVKRGMSKAMAAMNRGDLGIATALVDFMLEKHSGLLVKFLQIADSKKKTTDVAFQETFGKSPEEWDKEFLAWFKLNY